MDGRSEIQVGRWRVQKSSQGCGGWEDVGGETAVARLTKWVLMRITAVEMKPIQPSPKTLRHITNLHPCLEQSNLLLAILTLNIPTSSLCTLGDLRVNSPAAPLSTVYPHKPTAVPRSYPLKPPNLQAHPNNPLPLHPYLLSKTVSLTPS